MQQFHAGLLWCISSLTQIASFTSADYIFPAMFSTQSTWNNMVQGELLSLSATILASMLISIKYLNLIQLPLAARTLNHINQPYHRGNLKNLCGGVKHPSTIFQCLSFAAENQHHSSTHATQIERLISLIKN